MAAECEIGDVVLYRERPECLIVRALAVELRDQLWHYSFKVLKVINGRDRIGFEFEVTKHDTDGGMCTWYLFPLDSEYAKGWMDRNKVDVAEFI